MNKSVCGEKAGLPLPSNVEGISSNILLILTAKNYNAYEQSRKSCTRYSKQITLTYPDAKKLSKEISCINKEIKAVLRDYNFKYQSFNPKPLPLSEEGFRELESRLIELHERNHISVNHSKVFELIRNASEFLAFKQKLGKFIDELRMEMRIDDEGLEFLVHTPMLKKWIPVLCSYYSH